MGKPYGEKRRMEPLHTRTDFFMNTLASAPELEDDIEPIPEPQRDRPAEIPGSDQDMAGTEDVPRRPTEGASRGPQPSWNLLFPPGHPARIASQS